MGDINNTKSVVSSGIANALGVAPLELSVSEFMDDDKQLSLPIVTDEDKLVNEDFDTARAVLLNLLEQGQTALNKALLVAISSQSPRAYEVVSKLLKDVADVNQGLLALHESRRALNPVSTVEPVKQSANNIQNNFIISSPAQLLDLVKQARLDDAANKLEEDAERSEEES